MTIPLRSWLLGSVGAALGCGLFVFDSFIERLGPSAHNLHLWVETLEFSLVGPGLGILCLLLAERVRTLREAVVLQKSAERERRFILLGRMAASVAHEVRNPLHTLRLVVDELRVEQPALRSHPLSAHIDQSLERIDRAVDLVYQLARPGVEDDSSGDVVAALQEARTNLDRRHLSHRIEVHELPARALARCTPSGLRIIIDNLLRNATEAAPPGSVIDVHCGRSGCCRLRYIAGSTAWGCAPWWSPGRCGSSGPCRRRCAAGGCGRRCRDKSRAARRAGGWGPRPGF